MKVTDEGILVFKDAGVEGPDRATMLAKDEKHCGSDCRCMPVAAPGRVAFVITERGGKSQCAVLDYEDARELAERLLDWAGYDYVMGGKRAP